MIRVYFGYGKLPYFFGEVTALTIGKLIRMFGGKTESVPKKVAESGFPKGVLVCSFVELLAARTHTLLHIIHRVILVNVSRLEAEYFEISTLVN